MRERHPTVNLIVTLSYIIAVLGTDKYAINRLTPFFVYPIIIMLFMNISLKAIIKRLAFSLPFILFIGVFNPFLDTNKVLFFGKIISAGWFSFFAIIIKCLLSVTAVSIFAHISKIDGISYALRTLHVPQIIVSQFSFTYRYIHVFQHEAANVLTSYKLRASTKRGVDIKNFGSLCGGLFLRSYKRVDDIYSAMLLRGFSGEISMFRRQRVIPPDIIYLFLWTAFFIIISMYDISLLIGNFILRTGI